MTADHGDLPKGGKDRPGLWQRSGLGKKDPTAEVYPHRSIRDSLLARISDTEIFVRDVDTGYRWPNAEFTTALGARITVEVAQMTDEQVHEFVVNNARDYLRAIATHRMPLEDIPTTFLLLQGVEQRIYPRHQQRLDRAWSIGGDRDQWRELEYESYTQPDRYDYETVQIARGFVKI